MQRLARLAQLPPKELALRVAQFHYEEFAYAKLEPKSRVTAQRVAEWAANPGEASVCLSLS
jgi:hypothetical protein